MPDGFEWPKRGQCAGSVTGIYPTRRSIAPNSDASFLGRPCISIALADDSPRPAITEPPSGRDAGHRDPRETA